MDTIILNSETSALSIADLIERMNGGGVQLRDGDGNTVAFVLSPTDKDSLAYLNACHDLDQNRQEVIDALKRRGGVTTAEMLDRAKLALQQSIC